MWVERDEAGMELRRGSVEWGCCGGVVVGFGDRGEAKDDEDDG